jgi:hypothetical protein
MTSFEPTNELETQMVSVQKGELEQQDFLTHLVNSKAIVMLDQPPRLSGEWDNDIHPLVVGSPNGFPVLAVFSSVERSAVSKEKAPGHPYAMEAPFAWMLRGIQPGVGLVMNPGSAFGFEIPPDSLSSLRQGYGITEDAKA